MKKLWFVLWYPVTQLPFKYMSLFYNSPITGKIVSLECVYSIIIIIIIIIILKQYTTFYNNIGHGFPIIF